MSTNTRYYVSGVWHVPTPEDSLQQAKVDEVIRSHEEWFQRQHGIILVSGMHITNVLASLPVKVVNKEGEIKGDLPPAMHITYGEFSSMAARAKYLQDPTIKAEFSRCYKEAGALIELHECEGSL